MGKETIQRKPEVQAIHRPLNESERAEKIARESKEKIQLKCLKHTGKAFAFIFRPHLGFADYAVVELRLKDGAIESVGYISEPSAAFEARAIMETKQAYELENMRRSYPPEFQHV